jgi:hypothetical protein
MNRSPMCSPHAIPFSERSWARKSTLSAALDSIPSCSGEEEDVDTEGGNDDETTYASDEESGSYYFDETTQGSKNNKGGAAATTSTAGAKGSTPKVWRYGEPPTITTPDHTPLLKKVAPSKKRLSEHDRIMRRDRLLQEEYEYRLRSLQRENEKLSKKFRIFVLVTVAIIFTGAFTFAFVICIRMLMSI